MSKKQKSAVMIIVVVVLATVLFSVWAYAGVVCCRDNNGNISGEPWAKLGEDLSVDMNSIMNWAMADGCKPNLAISKRPDTNPLRRGEKVEVWTGTVYKAKAGDSIYKIAKKFAGNASPETLLLIREKNELDKSFTILPGQVLFIPGENYQKQ